jgi:hypothetical protein
MSCVFTNVSHVSSGFTWSARLCEVLSSYAACVLAGTARTLFGGFNLLVQLELRHHAHLRGGTRRYDMYALSYHILSYPILSYPILSYPIVSYPILSFPIPLPAFARHRHSFLSWPVLVRSLVCPCAALLNAL